MSTKRTERLEVQKYAVSEEMRRYAEEPTEDLFVEHRKLDRLVITQGQTPRAMAAIEKHGLHSAVLVPSDVRVMEKGQSILFVPLYFWSEFCLWSDRRDTSNPKLQERSQDKNGELAKRAKSRQYRTASYAGAPKDEKPFTKEYREHLCFPGVIYGAHELRSVPIVLNLSRGEYPYGEQFISGISRRVLPYGEDEAPQRAKIWMQVWEIEIGPHTSKDGKWTWPGFNIFPPRQASPIIDDRDLKTFKRLHEELGELYKSKRLETNMAGEDFEADGDGDLKPEGVATEEVPF